MNRRGKRKKGRITLTLTTLKLYSERIWIKGGEEVLLLYAYAIKESEN